MIKPTTKILIVEDEPALQDIYSTKLKLAGFTTIQAGDGVSGLDLALSEQPTLILLDLVMPIKDGYDTLRDLKNNAKTREIPVIVLSNLGQDYEVKRSMDLGAVSFMIKANTEPGAIVEKIKSILSAAGGGK